MFSIPFDRVLRRAGRAVAKGRRRSWAEWGMLGVAGVTVAGTAVLLRVLPFRRVQRLMAGQARAPKSSAGLSPEAERRLLWAVAAVGRRLLPNRPCLPQALAAQWLLRRWGARPARLQIGVARADDGSIEAHAWLERGGEVLIGGAASPRLYHTLSTGADLP